MDIRNTRCEDLDAVMEIYEGAREFMRRTGNANQWGNSHPARELIESDIDNKNGYVVEENGEIIASFFFKIGNDPTYDIINEGKWISDSEYGVIHRIAVKYQGRGIAGFIYDHCFNIIGNLKIDTHRDNLPMQKALQKHGFEYCGIIHIANGDERIAFQKVK